MKNALTKKLLALGVSSTIAISGGYLVGQWEGKENTAYKDMVGVVTACYGQTKGVKMGDVFTDEECEKDLASELSKYNIGMKRYVKVDLSPQEEIAYTSFVWNVGLGAWNSSSLLKKLNAGDREGACKSILDWNRATFSPKTAQVQIKNGEQCSLKKDGNYSCTVKGLTNRRLPEYKVCMGQDEEINSVLESISRGQKPLETSKNKSEGVDEGSVKIIAPEPSEAFEEIVPNTPTCKWKIFNICLKSK